MQQRAAAAAAARSGSNDAAKGERERRSGWMGWRDDADNRRRRTMACNSKSRQDASDSVSGGSRRNGRPRLATKGSLLIRHAAGGHPAECGLAQCRPAASCSVATPPLALLPPHAAPRIFPVVQLFLLARSSLDALPPQPQCKQNYCAVRTSAQPGWPADCACLLKENPHAVYGGSTFHFL